MRRINRNYTSAAVGVIMFIALVTWITTGYKQFKGPESGGMSMEMIEGQDDGDVSNTEADACTVETRKAMMQQQKAAPSPDENY